MNEIRSRLDEFFREYGADARKQRVENRLYGFAQIILSLLSWIRGLFG